MRIRRASEAPWLSGCENHSGCLTDALEPASGRHGTGPPPERRLVLPRGLLPCAGARERSERARVGRASRGGGARNERPLPASPADEPDQAPPGSRSWISGGFERGDGAPPWKVEPPWEALLYCGTRRMRYCGATQNNTSRE